ncbi:hypothetical protein CQ018_03220 [Arthrobacter sp. MYb227]|uniref:PucR family transcriptional regulator n=1 Tax=Arthrobacter sp. MYb227 TaxID=1848601 RepID=UPI000CFAD7E2|nr:PucR family transcriptional regulator [Arthrobacter sp. MYb227]PQZ96293.1 hypothetical protein CQ018_03220 [Arthrobacter sp. MYb227]
MALTIRRILGFAAVSNAHPQVLGQAQHLDLPVFGIHVTESADLAGLLEGGELILSSGLLLDDSLETTKQFLTSLAEAGAAGVIFSFLTDAPAVKKQLAVAAETASLPVILLDDRARFVEITETIYDLIYSAARGLSGVDAVSSFLESAAAAHLNVRDLFIGIADLLGEPLIFEDFHSTVVIHRGLGAKNMRRYLQAALPGNTPLSGVRIVGEAKWLLYPVIAQGRQLGQLVTPVGAGNLRASKVIEAIGTLIGSRLIHGPQDISLLKQDSLGQLIKEARSVEAPIEKDLVLRAHMLGVKPQKQFVPIALNSKRPKDSPSPVADSESLVIAIQNALLEAPHTAFAYPLNSGEVGIILCLPITVDLDKALLDIHERFKAALGTLGASNQWTMGIGTAEQNLTQTMTQGLDDARRVAHSASSMNHSSASYHRASDLGFRWLMQQLLSLEETRTYLHDQLAPFLDEPEYLDFIEIYLQTNGSITEMSRALHLSRPSVYARLRRIEKVLGHELTDADTMTSLHLAVTLYRLGVHDQEE